MRILQVSNKVPWPPRDGGAIATLSLARSLAAAGHQVHLLAMNTSKHRVNEAYLPHWMKEELHLRLVDVNTDIRPLKAMGNLFFSKYPYNYARFISTRFSQSLTECLQKIPFDIVQLEGLPLIWYAKHIRRNSKASLVLRAHNVEHLIWKRLSEETRRGLKRKYYRLLHRRIQRLETGLNEMDGVIYISSEDQRILTGMGLKKPGIVAWTGFEAGELPDHITRNNPQRLYFIGALDWLPNQEGLFWFLENIWPEILHQQPATRLYIAGRNASPAVARKIQNHPVFFLGEVPDAAEFAADKDILIVPLFSGSGIRIKIIEAMGHGKTVITTSIGAEGLPVQPGNDIIIADDPSDFIQQLLDLIQHPEKTRKIAAAAVKSVRRHFDNRAISRKVTEFYQNLRP